MPLFNREVFSNSMQNFSINLILIIIGVVIGLYILLCLILFLVQEKLIFKPEKIPADQKFEFDQDFEELFVSATDRKRINGLLFKTKNPKGLIFYMHGNVGSLNSWGTAPTNYIRLNYDVFIYDYRSFGKSEGSISSEKQLFTDNQLMYDEIKKRYAEDKIILLGHSLGSGMAAKLAADNHPKKLILLTPYYSMTKMMKNLYPYLPVFILKYKLSTHKYLKNCKMPIVIFHGDADQLINCSASKQLSKDFKPGDQLFILKGQDHYRVNENEDYRAELKKILE